MSRIAIFIVAIVAVCMSAETIDAGCGGGGGGAGLFSRFRARRAARQDARLSRAQVGRSYSLVSYAAPLIVPVAAPRAANGCNCPCNLSAPEAAPMATPKAAVASPVTYKTVLTTRPAQGHTHTCSQCGTTWDHAVTASHNCPACHAYQAIQDRTPRPVTVARTVRVDSEVANNADVPNAAPARAAPQTFTLPVIYRANAGSACANGSCRIR